MARLLGLVLAPGRPTRGPPSRPWWLNENLRLTDRLDSALAAPHAGCAERLARRVQEEWSRFGANALARLSGEPRGDAHCRLPGGEWSPERPVVHVIKRPPLPGEVLPGPDDRNGTIYQNNRER